MPIYSARSINNLTSCDLRLQRVAFEIINYFDITIVCGHRNKEEQDKAFHKGYSKLQWPNSKHNVYPSLAVDIAPYPTLYTKKLPFYYMAGYFTGIANRMGIKIRWGGDWTRDNDFYNDSWLDIPHFELI